MEIGLLVLLCLTFGLLLFLLFRKKGQWDFVGVAGVDQGGILSKPGGVDQKSSGNPFGDHPKHGTPQ